MTTSYGPIVRYKCFNDCVQTGCPGHTVKLVYHNTSDTMYFEEDGNERDREYEDPARWRAKMRAWERWRNGEHDADDVEDKQ